MKYLFEKYKVYLIVASLIIFLGLVFYSYALIEEEEIILEENPTTVTTIAEEFYVDVKGAVSEPGVYLFNTGDRVFDAIERAGGLTKNGNTSNINLAQKLTSEMVVQVYSNNEIKNGSPSINCSTVCETSTVTINNCYPNQNNDKININVATALELTSLTGVGESRALTIIQYREEHGAFKTIEDLMKVSGIGESIFNNIKDRITV